MQPAQATATRSAAVRRTSLTHQRDLASMIGCRAGGSHRIETARQRVGRAHALPTCFDPLRPTAVSMRTALRRIAASRGDATAAATGVSMGEARRMVSDRHRHLALFLSGLSGGGAQRRMLTLAAAFAARGHRVDVVVPSAQGPFAAELPRPARLVTLDPGAGRLACIRSRRPLRVLAAIPALAGYLRRERPDVVLSTSNPANLACVCARRLARSHTPLVLSANIHLSAAIARRARPWRPLLRWLARRV